MTDAITNPEILVLIQGATILERHQRHTTAAFVMVEIADLSASADTPLETPSVRTREQYTGYGCPPEVKDAREQQRRAVEAACTRSPMDNRSVERVAQLADQIGECREFATGDQFTELRQVAIDVADRLRADAIYYQGYGQHSTAGKLLLMAGALRKAAEGGAA